MKTHRNKETLGIMRDVKDAIRQPFAWPGGYPKSAICDDGGLLCPSCLKSNYASVAHDTVKGWDTGWRVVAVDICWEGGNHCNHCNTCVDAYSTDAEPQLETA